MTSEVKINYAYVITQGIYNKFIEVNFCVGCMVSSVATLNICQILMRFAYLGAECGALLLIALLLLTSLIELKIGKFILTLIQQTEKISLVDTE